ncbi:nucleotidyltransferase family protein [Cecembia lonarensis]|uniref:Bifunctional N-acetylglucosamine-1-phosphate uridyltransferase/glucosamine-1-phosphate acetyltransferase n=1 Tax=Cecembia lonarensis (strain CCUG 58316 / KCTC 22772 / LW9) TaxID=1225176 RepID=K1KWU3_CECL9|nr:nucleotidyltransferase family protein [Cecembia lonarensis]EKB48615.1 bifunctional N-acetylglucosamine-1-phosphate uridyltransferase/glucosamine-1-phosphate acetyltransferase [Cecembia lonarensis LW9]
MDLKNRYIDTTSSLLEALKKMDALDKKLLLVLDRGKFEGLLSIGDIQRAIINNQNLDTPVHTVLRKNIRYANQNLSFSEIRDLMIQYRMEMCPVLDNKGDLVDIHFWEDIFGERNQVQESFNLPVVVMAGGFGTRLKPLTNVLPKPLIPIGDKTMLEEIFSRFYRHGCNQFYVSVNYKAELIDFYLNSLKLPFKTECFVEDKPLGTAGSLHLLKGKITETFFVSNCDIIIEEDYSNILKYHQENNNEITLVAALKHFPIAYGTLETGEKGQLLALTEKPELTFKINSGMYVLEPHLIEEVPQNEFFHITDLINKIIQREGRVGVFPVSEKSWKDIGEANLLAKFFNG